MYTFIIQTIYTQLPSKSFSKNCVKLPCLCKVTPVDGTFLIRCESMRVRSLRQSERTTARPGATQDINIRAIGNSNYRGAAVEVSK